MYATEEKYSGRGAEWGLVDNVEEGLVDTSKKYIEMCEKAVEIQKKWKPYFGDFMFVRGNANLNTQVAIDTEKEEFIIMDTHIWLPRQDQLQEMIFHEKVLKIPYAMAQALVKYCAYNAVEPFNSSEQLWLAFVMNEKYKKTYNGNEWIEV